MYTCLKIKLIRNTPKLYIYIYKYIYIYILHFCSSHIKNTNPNKHDELSEENEELEKINRKIEKHEIIERINIKEIESEILDETKALEEIEIKLSKLKTTIMKKRFLE